jgi:hypothetical protein
MYLNGQSPRRNTKYWGSSVALKSYDWRSGGEDFLEFHHTINHNLKHSLERLRHCHWHVIISLQCRLELPIKTHLHIPLAQSVSPGGSCSNVAHARWTWSTGHLGTLLTTSIVQQVTESLIAEYEACYVARKRQWTQNNHVTMVYIRCEHETRNSWRRRRVNHSKHV